MKTFLRLIFLSIIGSGILTLYENFAFAQNAIKDFVSDGYPANAVQPVTCSLYLGGVKRITTPAIAIPPSTLLSAFFPSMIVSPKQSYTATCTDAVGFESDQSSPPLLLPGAVGTPTNLRVK